MFFSIFFLGDSSVVILGPWLEVEGRCWWNLPTLELEMSCFFLTVNLLCEWEGGMK